MMASPPSPAPPLPLPLQVYEEENDRFTVIWQGRVRDYEANFAKAVEDLKVGCCVVLCCRGGRMGEPLARPTVCCPRP